MPKYSLSVKFFSIGSNFFFKKFIFLCFQRYKHKTCFLLFISFNYRYLQNEKLFYNNPVYVITRSIFYSNFRETRIMFGFTTTRILKNNPDSKTLWTKSIIKQQSLRCRSAYFYMIKKKKTINKNIVLEHKIVYTE